MQKRIFTNTNVFKALLLAVFAVFYFVQVQASFIACTHNDFPSVSSAKHQHSFNVGEKNKEKKALVKLNKRYQAVDFIAIVPPFFELAKTYCFIKKEHQLLFIHLPVNFPYHLSLRGPPAFDSLKV